MVKYLKKMAIFCLLAASCSYAMDETISPEQIEKIEQLKERFDVWKTSTSAERLYSQQLLDNSVFYKNNAVASVFINKYINLFPHSFLNNVNIEMLNAHLFSSDEQLPLNTCNLILFIDKQTGDFIPVIQFIKIDTIAATSTTATISWEKFLSIWNSWRSDLQKKN